MRHICHICYIIILVYDQTIRENEAKQRHTEQMTNVDFTVLRDEQLSITLHFVSAHWGQKTEHVSNVTYIWTHT